MLNFIVILRKFKYIHIFIKIVNYHYFIKKQKILLFVKNIKILIYKFMKKSLKIIIVLKFKLFYNIFNIEKLII